MRIADLDAVTLDAYGTLVELDDPVGELERRTGAARADVEHAFGAEVEYYVAHLLDGRDEASLADLRLRCAAVFLRELRDRRPPESFVDELTASLRLRVLPGVREALGALRRRGLALAVVSNWDASLPARLDELGLDVDAVVCAAELGALKPDPSLFRVALDRLGVRAERTLHVGDSPEDEAGARAAGIAFAPVPLAAAVEALG